MDLTSTFSEIYRRGRAIGLLGIIAMGCLPAPALATPETRARLVRCGQESCVEISGRRANPAAVVRINGRIVPVEGDRRWRAHAPVHLVRLWSAPHARTIEVSLSNPDRRAETVASVDLPIGLLGGIDLASLTVRAR